uniref:Uncharacterized protein n=2 Tax=Caenorhabditis japonica TaxID=281687 RepID=A0A8R1DZY3_CAEJA
MVENIPIGLLSDIMRSFTWTIPSEEHEKSLMNTALLQQQLRQQVERWALQTGLLRQLEFAPLVPPSPTVSPTSLSSSSLSSTSSPPASRPTPKKSKTSTKFSPSSLHNELNRNTYSDCEKKHFLDVAYENNWGTTVAANKFTRIWGKGPTRRMFYWWREQFKKEHDREQKMLDDLHERKTELSLELAQLSNGNQLLAEQAQQVIQKIAVVDTEVSNVRGKRRKSVCSITGEQCVHGDGLQEESTVARKFTTPFVCDYCKMPFQKESTCYIHMHLCKTRCAVTSEKLDEEVSKNSSPIAVPPVDIVDLLHVNLHGGAIQMQANPSTELTELAEQLIARLAACAALVV